MSEREQYREKINRHLDELRSHVLPIGHTVTVSTTLGIAPADLDWISHILDAFEKAVAAQVLRDIAVLLVSEADDDDNVWMPWVDIDEFAKERGINLSE